MAYDTWTEVDTHHDLLRGRTLRVTQFVKHPVLADKPPYLIAVYELPLPDGEQSFNSREITLCELPLTARCGHQVSDIPVRRKRELISCHFPSFSGETPEVPHLPACNFHHLESGCNCVM